MKSNRVIHERVMTLTMSRHSTLPSKHNSLGTTYVPSMANYHDFRTDLLATLSSFTKISHFHYLAYFVTYGRMVDAAARRYHTTFPRFWCKNAASRPIQQGRYAITVKACEQAGRQAGPQKAETRMRQTHEATNQ